MATDAPASAPPPALDSIEAMASVHGIQLEREDPNDLFEIVATIGRGTFGSVYRARNKVTGEMVAVKQVPLSDPSEMENVRREVLTLQQCRHPNIVSYRGAYRSKSSLELWITLEYCAGGSFDNILKVTRTPLSEPRAAWVAKQMLLGLQYLHSRHTIHRDIKGGNVLLTEHGEVKLTDFGVSTQMMNTLSKRNSFTGTLHWMAPEAILEREYDERADIWSLGITIIELVQLVPPHFDMHPARLLFHIPREPPPKLDNPDLWSPMMHRFIARCLTKDPELRPTATELLHDPWIVGASRHCSAEDMKQLLVEYLHKAEHLNTARRYFGEEDPEADGDEDAKQSPAPEPKATATEPQGTTSAVTPEPMISVQPPSDAQRPPRRLPSTKLPAANADEDPTFVQLTDVQGKVSAEAMAQYNIGAPLGLDRFALVDLPLVSLSDVTLEEVSLWDAAPGTSSIRQSELVTALTQRIHVGGASAHVDNVSTAAAAGRLREAEPDGSSNATFASTGTSAAQPVLPKHIGHTTLALLRSFQYYSDGLYRRGIGSEAIENAAVLTHRYGSLLKSTLQI